MIFEDLKSFKSSIEYGKKLLSMDVGIKKVGLALSDNKFFLSSPFDTIIRTTYKKDRVILEKIIKDHNIGGFVVGWPLESNGNEGDSCKIAMGFAKKLIIDFDLPIYLQDERYSTDTAHSLLKDFNIGRKQREALDDKIAASIILQKTLEQMSDF